MFFLYYVTHMYENGGGYNPEMGVSNKNERKCDNLPYFLHILN